MGLHQTMYISPLYYFIEMGYAILLNGAGVDILWEPLLAGFDLTSIAFHKNIDI